MLRSLDPEKGYQPKERKKMDADELRYLDKTAVERERDLSIVRYRSRVESETILRAAQADQANTDA